MILGLVVDVARHDRVELDVIEEVGGDRYRPEVLVQPARDLGRAELYATQTRQSAARAGLFEFREVQLENGPKRFVVVPEFVKRRAGHHVDLIFDDHGIFDDDPRGVKRLLAKSVLLCEGITVERGVELDGRWIPSRDGVPDMGQHRDHLIFLSRRQQLHDLFDRRRCEGDHGKDEGEEAMKDGSAFGKLHPRK
jgi:hypothetical protein